MMSQPPPAPPPPPQGLRSVSPLNGGGLIASNNYVNNLPSTTSNLIIRPTTAGLLQHPTPAINFLSPEGSDGDQQVSSSSRSVSLSPSLLTSGVDFGSTKFKDELLAKQTKITDLNSVSPIEDRINSNKSNGKQASVLVNSPEMQGQSEHMPDKLVSTLRKEKRPFAYSPDVNDPNNRGKLDLTQIKSPIMRKRLLANMNSTDEDESNEMEFEEHEQTKAKPPREPKILRFDPTPILGISEKPGHIFIGGSRPRRDAEPEPVNIQYHEPIVRVQPPVQQHRDTRTKVTNTEQIIHHNEPPRFYNVSRPKPQVDKRQPGELSYQNQCDELADEVERSLASLSQLVSDLDFTDSAPRCNSGQGNGDTTLRRSAQSQTQRLSSFSPSANTYSLPRRNQQDYYSKPKYSDERPIGDFLVSESAGNSYFTTPAPRDGGPYVMSPFYGSSLEAEPSYGFQSKNNTAKSNTTNTFTPKVRYYQPPVQQTGGNRIVRHTTETYGYYGPQH